MKVADWQACRDPDAMVRALHAGSHQRELRLFAVGCVRRVWHLLPVACRAAVEASERFAEGQIAETDLAAAVAAADREAREAFPGHSAPDSHAYATSAAVDASSIWARNASNVLAATSCAASAVACETAEAEVEEFRYDETFDSSRLAELAAQATLLRSLVIDPPERSPA